MSDKLNDDFNDWLNNESKKNEEIDLDYNKDEILNDTVYLEDNNDEIKNEDYKFERRTSYYSQFANKEYVDEQIKKNKPKYGFLKAVSLVVVGTIIGAFISPLVNSLYYTGSNNSLPFTSTSAINISTVKEQNVENAVAKKAIPSVVGIKVKYEQSSGFFGRTVEGEGIGSGVIVSRDGYILTNAHVLVDNSTSISVLFSDNSTSDAKIIWKDETLDLGIIKVDKTNLIPIEIADSDSIQIGDKAIAIGNPVGLNLQSTLTSGYISGLDRSITVEGNNVMNGLIQTDASINSGNSGGALLNSEGKLIGINTAKAGNTDGIGFAIPSNIAKSIVNTVIQKGDFTPVTLGIKGINVLNYKQYYGNNNIKADKGIYVSEVVNNTAAEEAGIKSGDVIVSVNDEEIESMNKLKQILLKYKPGDEIKVKVNRDNKDIELNLTFSKSDSNA